MCRPLAYRAGWDAPGAVITFAAGIRLTLRQLSIFEPGAATFSGIQRYSRLKQIRASRMGLHLECSRLGCGDENNMKCAFSGWLWQLLVVAMLLTGSLFADSPEKILYPGSGTTVNGQAAYSSVVLVRGDRVQTATTMGKITAGLMDLDMAPNTIIFIGEPLVLDCGSVIVRSGMAEVSDGKITASFAAGESAHAISTFCGALVPDAPSAVWSERNRETSPRSTPKAGAAPAATSGVLYVDFKVANWSYWTLTGTMSGSSLASAKLTEDCLHSGACSEVPHAFRSHAAMYGAGLAAATGVSYLTYYLKKKGYRWWLIPEALITAGNVVISKHAAHYSR